MVEEQQQVPLGPFPEAAVVIGIPSQIEWHAEMALCLTFMIHVLTMNLVKFHILNKRGSILPQLRQDLLDFAISNNASHLLFIDSDQTFPEVLLLEWLKAKRPVVAANIATKGMPSYPTAKRRVGGVLTPFYSDTAGERFSRVQRVGTGIMLLDLETMKKLPRPAFTPYWNPSLQDGKGGYIFEDWALAEHLEALDIPVVVDNAISQTIGHIGTRIYDHTHIVATRKLEAENGSRHDSDSRIITAR